MKRKNLLIMLFVTFKLFICFQNLFSIDCKISPGIFDFTDNQCDQYNKTIDNAVKQLVNNLNKAFKNPDDDCIPKKLRGLLKDRLCSNGGITISCTERKQVKVGTKRVWDRCNNRWNYVDVYEQRGGGAHGSDMIEMSYDKLKQGAKITEMTLYHELIHIAENYYGLQEFGKKGMTNEDYSYTCTKKYYDDSKMYR